MAGGLKSQNGYDFIHIYNNNLFINNRQCHQNVNIRQLLLDCIKSKFSDFRLVVQSFFEIYSSILMSYDI